MLVRGEDRWGHFTAEHRIGTALSDEAYENHRRLMAQFRARQDSGADIKREVAYSAVT